MLQIFFFCDLVLHNLKDKIVFISISNPNGISGALVKLTTRNGRTGSVPLLYYYLYPSFFSRGNVFRHPFTDGLGGVCGSHPTACNAGNTH